MQTESGAAADSERREPRVLIVRNTQAGTAVIRLDPSDTFAERLPNAHLHELDVAEDLDAIVADALAADPSIEVLGVYGGDGSVSRMAHLARRHDRPLLVLPGGTFNHFARAVGVTSVDEAIDALQEGTTREVQAVEATVDDSPSITVLNAISIGVYPELIYEREERRGFGKWFGGVIAAWNELRRAEPVTIVRDGRRALVWSVFVSVGRNDPARVATMQRSTLDDSVLDVRIHHARGSRVRALASLAFGRRTAAVMRAVRLFPPKTDVERVLVRDLTLDVRAAPGHPAVYVHDGELEESDRERFTLRCVAVPQALRVFAPPAE